MEKTLINSEELAEMLGIAKSTAGKYVTKLNEELEDKGYLTIKGYIPKRYVKERFYMNEEREYEK